MNWGARFRLRQRIKGSLWFVPFVAAILGVGLAQFEIWAEGHLDLPSSWQYSEQTASTVLSAIVAAMVGLTGFVVAFGVLIVQMATQTLSPRFMRLWYRDGLQKAVFGIFVGTLTFAFALLRRVEANHVPSLGVTIAGVALTTSVVLFLFYLDRFVHRLRPVAVAALVSRYGARVFEEADPLGDLPAPVGPAVLRDEPTLIVRATRAGSIQAIDVHGLPEVAARFDCLLVAPRAVGDFVAHGAPLFEVHGTGSVPEARRLRRMVALGTERTIEQDPAFAVRVLVDVAIRALSPAVNDPTTAVQVLDHLEDLLQRIGESDLEGRGTLRDRTGAVRVLVPWRRWEEYLALGVTEIREYGGTATQVTRRLRALLENLLVRVRPAHRAAVEAELAKLDATLRRRIDDDERREFASRPDRQGIGGPVERPIAHPAEITSIG